MRPGFRTAAARRIGVVVVCGTALLGSAWKGLDVAATVAGGAEMHWRTPTLPAGDYRFLLTGTAGNADLYVRVGAAPTPQTFDCHPGKGDSNETCYVRLAHPAVVHVMVRGLAPMSRFRLVARAR